MSARDRSRNLKAHALLTPAPRQPSRVPAERQTPGPVRCGRCRREIGIGEQRQEKARIVCRGGCGS